jgi:hypothetical protein
MVRASQGGFPLRTPARPPGSLSRCTRVQMWPRLARSSVISLAHPHLSPATPSPRRSTALPTTQSRSE